MPGLRLGLCGTGRLHRRLRGRLSEVQVVDGKHHSAAWPRLHAEQTQSEHAPKQRCSQGEFDREGAGLPEPARQLPAPPKQQRETLHDDGRVAGHPVRRLHARHPHLRLYPSPGRRHTDPRLNQHHHPHPVRTSRSSRGRATFKTRDNTFSVSRAAAAAAAASRLAEPTSLHPRLFTWGPSSAPTPTYPSWIQDCDGSEPPLPAESELWHDHGDCPAAAPRTGAPSWVAELEDDDPDRTRSQFDSQLTLRDLRLQFAEQISLLTTERKSSDIVETLFRDNRIESLIQKADQVLNSLCPSREGAVSPVPTEELLLTSFTLDEAGAAGGNTRAAEVQSVHASGRGLRGSSTRTQPGPVEALKQMLFRLQTLEAKLRPRGGGEEEEEAPAPPDGLKTHQTPVTQTPEGEDSFSCGPSLHRALHHLGRLKLLVEEEPRKKTGEEKDEDEGRYSSSSADRLSCSQQKP
ncbi:lung adenoma susceptibility protein 2 isoform X4 [Scophthalmus maximus]|uniref:lung adenoma susceptibility protein 2 isoform X4 n=1 Tax=Scophthalmus maximus TaxID=52904 RepID=UPI001FA81BED|nr:lung adenoma susceptibility protein 2 isoform X4 [Scophthalmus maximus]